MRIIYSKENIALLTRKGTRKKSRYRKLLKKTKKWLFRIGKKMTFVRRMTRIVLQIRRSLRYNHVRKKFRVDDKMILFSAFDGRNYSDSPKAIYLRMLSDPAYKDYKFVWAFRKVKKNMALLENPNTYIVKVNTGGYEQICATAKYWMFNYRIADHIYPKADQVYVELWHGTPLKRLGYDIAISDNALNSKAEIRDKYRIDAQKFKYMLAPSPFAAEKFESAWNLKAVGKSDTLLVAGYPRNDFLINHTQKQVLEIRRRLKLPPNKKVILYAPTWRDNQHKSGVGYTYELGVDFNELRRQLGKDYVILFRAHYLVASRFNFKKFKGFVYNVSAMDDINELYVASDLLITDYSSVFFDYANLNRPILFYMYDLEDYGTEIRGFYIDLKELPGDIVENQEDLVDAIKAVRYDSSYYAKKYKEFHEKFNPLDDGKASERVIRAVLETE